MNTPRWELVKFPQNPMLIVRLIEKYFKENVLLWENIIPWFFTKSQNNIVNQQNHVNDNLSNDMLLQIFWSLDIFSYEFTEFMYMYHSKFMYTLSEISFFEKEFQVLHSNIRDFLYERWLIDFEKYKNGDDFPSESNLFNFLRNNWIDLPEFDVESFNLERLEAIGKDLTERALDIIELWEKD